MVLKITFEYFELLLTGLGIVAVICGIMIPFIWNKHRARKRDFNDAMEKKADGELFLEKLKSQNLKIIMQETSLNLHTENNKVQFEIITTTLNRMTARVDEIHTILSSK